MKVVHAAREAVTSARTQAHGQHTCRSRQVRKNRLLTLRLKSGDRKRAKTRRWGFVFCSIFFFCSRGVLGQAGVEGKHLRIIHTVHSQYEPQRFGVALHKNKMHQIQQKSPELRYCSFTACYRIIVKRPVQQENAVNSQRASQAEPMTGQKGVLARISRG